MTSPLSLDYAYDTESVGWVCCYVRFGEETCAVAASYTTDAFGDMLVAINALFDGLYSASVSWDTEPFEHRWAFVRTAANKITVTILDLDGYSDYRPDSAGNVLMTFECSLLDFARALYRATANAREGFGQYWACHCFPEERLAALQAHITVYEKHWEHPEPFDPSKLNFEGGMWRKHIGFPERDETSPEGSSVEGRADIEPAHPDKREILAEIEKGGRFVIYPYCFSWWATFRRQSKVKYIAPGKSAVVAGWPYALVTLLAGWWGIAGPVFSFECLMHSWRGGIDVTAEVLAQMNEAANFAQVA